MGKFILCSGREAKKPFYFSLTDTRIYTIEELCYYLYHNIYSITAENFDNTLVKWLKEEAAMEEIADKLSKLIKNKNSIKDIVVSILCSADYYTEDEIKDLIQTMDLINDLTPIGRQKHVADNYLIYRNYSAAAAGYDKILKGSKDSELSPEEYGDILHNKAIAMLHTASFREAAEVFREAYARNQNPVTLKEYFFVLILGKGEQEARREAENLPVSDEELSGYLQEFYEKQKESEFLPLHKSLTTIADHKENGRMEEYYQNLDIIIQRWKKNYRREIG